MAKKKRTRKETKTTALLARGGISTALPPPVFLWPSPFVCEPGIWPGHHLLFFGHEHRDPSGKHTATLTDGMRKAGPVLAPLSILRPRRARIHDLRSAMNSQT